MCPYMFIIVPSVPLGSSTRLKPFILFVPCLEFLCKELSLKLYSELEFGALALLVDSLLCKPYTQSFYSS